MTIVMGLSQRQGKRDGGTAPCRVEEYYFSPRHHFAVIAQFRQIFRSILTIDLVLQLKIIVAYRSDLDWLIWH